MDPLFCSKCRYELIGLPPKGTCPECGQKYDVRRRIGVRYRETPEERGDRIMRRVRTGIYAFLAIASVVLGVSIHLAIKSSNALTFGFFFAVVFLILTFTSYLAHTDHE